MINMMMYDDGRCDDDEYYYDQSNVLRVIMSLSYMNIEKGYVQAKEYTYERGF